MKILSLLTPLFITFLAGAQTHIPSHRSTGICREDSIYGYNWDTVSNTYTPASINFYTYTNNGDIATERQVSFNGSTRTNAYYAISTYDANNHKTQILNQNWTNNNWVSSGRYTYTYSPTGDLTQQISEQWNNNQWQNLTRSTSSYDANHNLLVETSQYWASTNWENTSQTSYTVDANGNVLTSISQSWASNTNVWYNWTKQTNTYDTSNNILTGLTEQWNQSFNAWTNYEKSTSMYDMNNNRLSVISHTWDANVNSWINQTNWTFTYNSSNQLTSQLMQNGNNNTWVNYEIWTQTYDINGLLSTSESQSWSNNSWVNTYRFYYYYDCSVTGLKASGLTKPLALFPNPTQTTLFIDAQAGSKVTVINVFGQTVKEETTQGTLTVSDLPAGAYYIQVYDAQTLRLKTGRFIKD